MPHCLPRPLAPSRLARENHKAAAALRQMKINVLLCNSLTMFGSACFLVGSVLYLPTIGCTEYTVRCGTWLFLVGSCLFVWAGVLPIVNKRLRAASEEAPPFETVVHGTVRLKRARPTFQALGRAVNAANRLNSPLRSPFISPPHRNVRDSPPAE